MSKQKTQETETENQIEKTQDDIFSAAKETEKPSAKKTVLQVNTVSTSSKSVSSNKKMGVYKFLMLYPQNIYIETLLKFYYPSSFYTKDEWFQRIEDILNKPIYN